MEDNQLQESLPDVSFNNTDELGSGQELVDKVSGLIGVFQNPAIDFRTNRASGDDIIGDAYEYFMMKFAQESGKSKGQFYTPSEVSRIIARLIGIGDIKPMPDKSWTLYDPAAGSGSLLIRAADEAPLNSFGDPLVTIFGQEKDHSTAGLANMNLVLHQEGTGRVERGNTLVDPFFKDDFGHLRTFDFIVMNPPFSDKSWSDGLKASDDPYHRFEGFGIPPEKNGDFAWFLHVIKSLDSKGKAGIVMPHGILFRGNAEETIRKEILKRRYIKGIVSLPANLFFGTGIPACLVFIDKEDAETREGIFFIDASSGFKKDGNKNRLREQDIEKIVRVYTAQEKIRGYSRMVPYSEITDENTNNGNMNVPRYIQKVDDSLPQNIAAHLRGGIPKHDIDTLDRLWTVSSELKDAIFTCVDPAHDIYQLALTSEAIEAVFEEDAKLQAKRKEGTEVFESWRDGVKELLLGITNKTDPKLFIRRLGSMILEAYEPTAASVRTATSDPAKAGEEEYKKKIYERMLGGKKLAEYETEVKEMFKKAPAKMKLLIVVDKLLTGFDAPSATYLYIDKSMRDHDLFQSICRVNRPDGEDKDYGYIVDYMDLFRNIQSAVHDYTSGTFDQYDKEDIEGLIKDRYEEAKSEMVGSLASLKDLLVNVPDPKADTDYIEYFCGSDSESDEKTARRDTLYSLTASLTRSFASCCNRLVPDYGYTEQQVTQLRSDIDGYNKIKEMIKLASCDYIDLKPYEADMRYILDTYIRADDSKLVNKMADMSLVELLLEGRTTTPADLIKDLPGDETAKAETIENNLKHEIVKKMSSNEVCYGKLSEMLEDVIEQRRIAAMCYEEYLRQVVELAQAILHPEVDDTYPEGIRDSAARRAIYDYLEGDHELTIGVDSAIRISVSPDWHTNHQRAQKVRITIYKTLIDASVEKVMAEEQRDGIFDIAKRQEEYDR